MKRKILAVMVAAVSLTGCGCFNKPEWLDTTINWHDRDSNYLCGNTILNPNQLIGIPRDAAYGEIVSAFRQNDGTYTLTEMVVRAYYVNPDDTFEYILDQQVTAEPFVVPILVRDANGVPIYGVLHLTVDATYTVEGPYHDEVAGTKQSSCKLVPAEMLKSVSMKESEQGSLLWRIIKTIMELGGIPSTTWIGGS